MAISCVPKSKKTPYIKDLSDGIMSLVRLTGPENAFFLILAVGNAVALALKPSILIFWCDAVLIGGWLVNKLVNDYVHERQQERELKKLKLTQGVDLLKLHRDRQRLLEFGNQDQRDDGSD